MYSEIVVTRSTPTLELFQTEWCPSSHRVRQRLTELNLPCFVRQVPADKPQRLELLERCGVDSIPTLVGSGGEIVVGEEAILAYLDNCFCEPAEAEAHRAKAEKARRRLLEEVCP